MRSDVTEISVDTAVNMMAYVCARHPRIDADIVKDAYAMALAESGAQKVFDIDELYAQTLERAEILKGI